MDNSLAVEELKLQMRERWNRFSNHREHISGILEHLLWHSNRRISVWGAGPCVDIDLEKLLPIFENIELVDIDKEALDTVQLLQEGLDFSRIHFYGDIDLFGLSDFFKQWNMQAPSEASVEKAKEIAICHSLPMLYHNNQVTLSDCVLSQVLEKLALTMGETHPQLLSMICTVRLRHIELLLTHTCPGGYVLLITDMTSYLLLPVLNTISDEYLSPLMNSLIEAKLFFTGCNPYAVIKSCRENGNLIGLIEKIELVEPWVWQLKEGNVLVYCLIIQKKLTPAFRPDKIFSFYQYKLNDN